MSENLPVPMNTDVEQVAANLPQLDSPGGWQKYARFLVAALGGIPWIGGVLAATTALHVEVGQETVSDVHRAWLEEHQRKLADLAATLESIVRRVNELGEDATSRLQDTHYLDLVRKGFRVWDQAGTEEKRDSVRRLLTNSAGTKVCSDDLVRLFLDWLDTYHESHLAVVRAVYREPGSTRADVWDQIHGADVREDSAEADLFKLLIRDLSMGSVIRQERDTDLQGRYLNRRVRRPASRVMKSAFDDNERYILTALGRQFVHYVLDEPAPRIGECPGSDTVMPRSEQALYHFHLKSNRKAHGDPCVKGRCCGVPSVCPFAPREASRATVAGPGRPTAGSVD